MALMDTLVLPVSGNNIYWDFLFLVPQLHWYHLSHLNKKVKNYYFKVEPYR